MKALDMVARLAEIAHRVDAAGVESVGISYKTFGAPDVQFEWADDVDAVAELFDDAPEGRRHVDGNYYRPVRLGSSEVVRLFSPRVWRTPEAKEASESREIESEMKRSDAFWRKHARVVAHS